MSNEVTPFLVEKWKESFYLFDIDKDGVLSSDDYGSIGDYISKKTGATAEETTKSRKEWEKWAFLCHPDPSKPLELDLYITGVGELFKDVDKHRAYNRDWASDFFDRLDLNKDGKISLEELSVFYEAVGVTNTALVASVFKALDKDQDGYIQREELIEDAIRHFTNPDPVDGRAFLISPVMK